MKKIKMLAFGLDYFWKKMDIQDYVLGEFYLNNFSILNGMETASCLFDPINNMEMYE